MSKCPVCKQQTADENSRICLMCGWEFRYILGDISQEEFAVYNKKLEISRQNWEMLQAFKNRQQQESMDKSTTLVTASLEKEQTKKKKNNVAYSEGTPVPVLKRDPFEILEEFQVRICDYKPVPAGKVRLIKEKYDIKTGIFPVEISWDEWVKDVQGNNHHWDSWLKVDRDTARMIYAKTAEYPLYVRLKTREEAVYFMALELSTPKGIIPLQIPESHVWKEPTTGIELIYVPGGSFKRGKYKIHLDGFYIGKYPVTQAQWTGVMKNNPSHFKKGDDYPMESVSWEDTKVFLQKLSEQVSGSYTFRLPTEAEWEYAARSGGRTETYAGGENIDAVAWYGENSNLSTHPVGKKLANGLGIHDMSGNVLEWCEDWYGEYSSGSVENPKGPDSGSYRVLRGGSWDLSAVSCRAALRIRLTPDLRGSGLGFRFALSPGQH